jgi:hypothetical protein
MAATDADIPAADGADAANIPTEAHADAATARDRRARCGKRNCSSGRGKQKGYSAHRELPCPGTPETPVI